MTNWSKEETDKFINLYPTVPTKDLVLMFNRSKSSLATKASELGIKKEIRADGLRYIGEEEKDSIIKSSKYHSIPELEKLFNRDFTVIKRVLSENNCDIIPSNRWWTKEEETFLRENFELGDSEYISNFLGKKWRSISKKAREMGMKRINSKGFFHKTPKPIDDDESNFIDNNHATMSVSMLSEKLNKSHTAITNYCKKNGLSVIKLRKNLEDYSDEFLLGELNKFSLSLGRCPTTKEVQENLDFPSIDTFYDRFGSFSNACELIGLTPNIGSYGTLCYSKNGDKCYSIQEQIITDYLIDNSINYIKEYPYSDIILNINCDIVMDWYINNCIVVEFFGMQKFEKYELKTKFKQKLCKENNIRLISLFPRDIRYLDKIFYEFINKNP
jgi:hypothetical protein